MAAGAIWEVPEWLFDMAAPGDATKGKDDTVINVATDTIGAPLAGWASLTFLRPPEKAPW